jgi:hypothetical protein
MCFEPLRGLRVPSATEDEHAGAALRNLGVEPVMEEDPWAGNRVLNICADAALEEVRKRVRAEIEHLFKVAPDFIRPNIATSIFDALVAAIVTDLEEAQGIRITLADTDESAREVEGRMRARSLGEGPQ